MTDLDLPLILAAALVSSASRGPGLGFATAAVTTLMRRS